MSGGLLAGNNEKEASAHKWMKSRKQGFIENKGQFADEKGKVISDVLYNTSLNGVQIYLTKQGLTYLFVEKKEEEENPDGEKKTIPHRWNRVTMNLKDATIAPSAVSKLDPLPNGFTGYYLPQCPDGILNLSEYGKLIVKNVYPGIDWVLYSGEVGFKYDFIVHPGADAGKIRMQFDGAKKLKLTKDKQYLRIITSLGELKEGPVKSFESEGRASVFSSYAIEGNTVFFKVGTAAGKTNAIIIDPPLLLVWATYYAGDGLDGIEDITEDSSGNIFITGYSDSKVLPTQMVPGAYYNGTLSLGGTLSDLFLLKFTSNGVLLWATYYGGGGDEHGTSLAIDQNDNIYLTGYTTSPNFPTQVLVGAYNVGVGGGGGFGYEDSFIIKFNSSGARLWATFFGGNYATHAMSVVTDASNNLFLTGFTNCDTGFPIQNSAGAFNQATKLGPVGPPYTKDIFIAKFDPAGLLLWSTYYGGAANDYAVKMCVAPSGNIFITGNTASADFKTQDPGSAYMDITLNGTKDAYILEFSNAGALIWSTYIGGNTYDMGDAIHCLPNGDVYVGGETNSTDLTTLNPLNGAYYQPAPSGNFDLFFTRFSSVRTMLWSTYFGGTSNDGASSVNSNINNGDYCYDKLGISSDPSGNIYFSGTTPGNGFPLYDPADGTYFNSTSTPYSKVFILRFDASNVQTWGTYGPNSASGWAEALLYSASSSSLYTVGEAVTFTNVNPGGGAFQGNSGLKDDAYVWRFSASICNTPTVTVSSTTPAKCFGSNDGAASLSATGGVSPYRYNWSNAKTGSIRTNLAAGKYIVTVLDAAGCAATATLTITQPQAIVVGVTSFSTSCGRSDGKAMITASGGTPSYHYKWFDGSSLTSISFLSQGTYSVTITDLNNCSINQSVIINNIPGPNLTFTVINVTCFGAADGTAGVAATGGFGAPYIYNWLPSGGSLASANSLNPGNYTVTVTDANACTAIQNISITEPLPLQVTITLSFSCVSGSSAQASASGGTSPYIYQWSNGTGGAQNLNLIPQVYSVTVTDGNACMMTNTVNVISTASLSISLNNDTTILQGETVTLHATVAGSGIVYEWSPVTGLNCINCPDPVASPMQTTTYCINITDVNTCTITSCVTITVDKNCGDIFVPTAFSPNDDVENDRECVFGKCLKSFILNIYDRWGNKVFTTSDVTVCWDGKYKGKVLNSAIFVYHLTAVLYNDEVVTKSGNISLVK